LPHAQGDLVAFLVKTASALANPIPFYNEAFVVCHPLDQVGYSREQKPVIAFIKTKRAALE